MRTPALALAAIIPLPFFMTTAANAQCVSDVLAPNDPAPSAHFGNSVGVSGGFGIVGANSLDAVGAVGNGAAYIFARSGLAWNQTQKLLPGDLDANKNFGASVSIDGDYAAVSAPNDPYSGFTNLGSVYIYHRLAGNWVQEANVLCPAANRANLVRFGTQVSLNGASLAVGAQYENSSRGAVYVFTRTGTSWTLEQRLQPAGMAAAALFGGSLDIKDDNLVVGAQGDNSVNGNATGAVYVFSRAAGAWTQRAKIVGSTATSSTQFGRSVSLSGTRLAVAAPFKDSGAAYVFRQLDINTWAQEGGAIMSPDAPQASIYAQDLSMDETVTHLAISGSSSGPGGPAVVDIFQRISGSWQFMTRRSQVAANAQYGNAIDFQDGVLMVGAMSADPSGIANAGLAYAYLPYENQSDLCQNAVLLPLGTTYGCTTGMQANGDSPLFNDNTAPDVYYKFSPICTGRFYITTEGSAYDTVLSVHSSCGANVNNAIASNDDIAPGNLNSAVFVDVARGQAVYVRVGGFGTANGAFQLSISETSVPNDYCVNATQIEPGDTTFGTCLAVTDGAPFNGCGQANTNIYNDVWFKFTAGCTGPASVDTCNSPHPWDAKLAVFAADNCGQIGSASLVACSDDGCGLHASAGFQAAAGQTYYIRVGGSNAAVRGSGLLHLSLEARCPADYNDDGGIDGSDVQAFFNDWEGGLPASDVNCDGGIDGADVGAFFTAWENGGC